MIQAFVLDSEFSKEFRVANTEGYITSLDRINLFIGVNNSGKSRLIRTIFTKLVADQNKMGYLLKDTVSDLVIQFNQNSKRKLANQIQAILSEYDFAESEYFAKLAEDLSNKSMVVDFPKLLEIADRISKLKAESLTANQEIYSSLQRVHRAVLQIGDMEKILIQGLNRAAASNRWTYACIYIPVVRGLRPIHQIGIDKFDPQDNYTARTTFDYFKPIQLRPSVNGKIFTGLTMYEDIKKLLLGNVKERKLISDFEEFLKRKIFDGKTVTLIPRYEDDVLHIKIGDDDQYPIYNLGDGLQALIVILFPVFIRKDKNCLFFIEEPESHLHPKFQRVLADALLEMENHQFFISTHSSTFLNSPETCIYSVSKQEDPFSLKLLNIGNEKRKLLVELGYKASDVLLPNFILWVEGPSDKIYFDYWIRNFSDGKLIPGNHYEILMYHGSYERNLDLVALASVSTHYGVYMDSDLLSVDDEIKESN